MLYVVEGVLRCWALAGLIYEGPSTSPDAETSISDLEIIRARRAHFINIDGSLDVARWESVQSPSRRC